MKPRARQARSKLLSVSLAKMVSFWFSDDPVENREIQYREELVAKRYGLGGFLL